MNAAELRAHRFDLLTFFREKLAPLGGSVFLGGRGTRPYLARLGRAAFAAAGVDHSAWSYEGAILAHWNPNNPAVTPIAPPTPPGNILQTWLLSPLVGELPSPLPSTFVFLFSDAQETVDVGLGDYHAPLHCGALENLPSRAVRLARRSGGVVASPIRAAYRRRALTIGGSTTVGISAPGVVFSALPFVALCHVLESSPEATRAWAAAFSTAINAARRSGNANVLPAFTSYPAAPPPADLDTLERQRQHVFTAARAALRRSVVYTRMNAEREAKRLENMKRLVPLQTSLDRCVKNKLLRAAFTLPDNQVLLQLPTLRVRCDANAAVAGLFELPDTYVLVPQRSPTRLRFLDENGNCLQHPHVRAGDQQGNPCWGETDEDKKRNLAYAEDSWNTNVEDFVRWAIGFVTTMYGEGTSNYQPFSAWCRRVEE